MANLLQQNPWNLDTPGPGIVWAGAAKLRHIEFSGYAGATDVCIVTNRYGHIIAQLTASADLQEVRTSNIGWVDGLIIPTLTSGICLVFFE